MGVSMPVEIARSSAIGSWAAAASMMRAPPALANAAHIGADNRWSTSDVKFGESDAAESVRQLTATVAATIDRILKSRSLTQVMNSLTSTFPIRPCSLRWRDCATYKSRKMRGNRVTQEKLPCFRSQVPPTAKSREVHERARRAAV